MSGTGCYQVPFVNGNFSGMVFPFVMDVTIDDYGRIVIPKEVRDRLGIEAGSALEIRVDPDDGAGGAITLTPKGQEPVLQQKGALLVHSGTLTEEEFDVVEQIRSERHARAQAHAGLGG